MAKGTITPSSYCFSYFNRMAKLQDLTGKRFGYLTVLECAGKRGRAYLWKCKCDCGKEKVILGGSLKTGHTKSCGCYNSKLASERNSTHHLTETRIYETWQHMKQRCNLPTSRDYKNYGARGIKVCEEWYDFQTFYDWAMANGYTDELTIDRIDNDGDYCPENCRWTSRAQQGNNTRRNHYFVINGERLTLAQVARKYNINYNTLNNRIWHGMSIEDALTVPIDTRKRKKCQNHKNTK